jgi:cell wall-associated NlpC family hydrolase
MTLAARISAFMICVLGTGLAGLAQAGPPQDRVAKKAPSSQSAVKTTQAKGRVKTAAPAKAATALSSTSFLPAAAATTATASLKPSDQTIDPGPAGQPAAPVAKSSPSVQAKPDLAAEVVFRALSLLGVNYRFGGSTPASGLDCSGLVMYVFNEVTGVKLPRRSDDMSRVGGSIDRSELQAGDLVFFNTMRFPFSHVGIFIGNGQFVHAPSTGSTVRVENMNLAYWQSRFNGARRLLPGESMAMTPSSALIVDADGAGLLRPIEAVSSPVSPPAATAPAGKPASRVPENGSRDSSIVN